ncbi:hypothetical protein GCM10022408_33070 [Hymenobacter fastidiosus]|uniref:T9SS type A sorting domain-containing protein n=1 Tax=Hymenobacter fastidiosus TaxID=486264 RepID=A0ABP7SV51_9BACT
MFASLGLTHTAQAQANSSITGSSIIIDRGTGNETFVGKGGTAPSGFEGQNLGTFDVSDFGTSLVLNGGSLFTTEAAPDIIQSGVLSYGVTNTATGATNGVKTVQLPLVNTTGGAKTFFTDLANQNLLIGTTANSTLAPGSYVVNIFFTANGFNSAEPRAFTIQDPPGSTYQATFTVTGVRPTEGPNSTTWTGGKNDNWFDDANWTQGVPTATKDATVPDFGSGSTVQYPNIYSDAIKPATTTTTTVQNPDGTFSTVTTTTPGYNNTGSGPARTRSLTMQGTSQAQRSITRLNVGRLEVYGDFNNNQDSFIQRENTTISFTGTTQSISGSTSGFVNVEIDGGGVKTLVNSFSITPGGQLRFINGILSTDIGNTKNNFVELAPPTVVGTTPIASGRLVGESETSYLRGFVKIAQPGTLTTQDYGNVGLTLTFFTNDPGLVTVTRNTGENFLTISNGANSKPSIRRIFGVRPADAQTSNGGLRATMVFHYLDNETKNLAPNSQMLDESKLALFVSTSSGDLFGQLGRDALDTGTNNLTKNNVTSFATFTLSEFTSPLAVPLPVTLTAFGAKRIGPNAEITWESVTELNSRGYEVQVSSDGRVFRALAFIPSASPNSNRLRGYQYLDTEANKGGIRYYRLRQVDVDGKEQFYAPKALNFTGTAAAESRLEAYPNPFQSDVRLTVQSTVVGKGRLVLLDMTGRVVREQAAEITAGANDLELPGLTNLPAGAYVLRVLMPDGKAQSLRVLKR